MLHNSNWEREVRKCRKKPTDTKISEEGARAEVSLQPVERTVVEQAVPCSLWCTMAEQISMLRAQARAGEEGEDEGAVDDEAIMD